MAIPFKDVAQRLEQQRIVIDQQHAHAWHEYGALFHADRRARCHVATWESDLHRRASTRRAVDHRIRPVALRNAIDHGEPEASAALTLGGEKGLHAATARVFVHAHTTVAHFHTHLALFVNEGAQR